MKKRLKYNLIQFAVAMLLTAGTAGSVGQNLPSREYQVKAVFLFNFTKFIEWPAAVFSGPESPFVIGVLGDDPFGAYLDDAIAGEHVKGHPIIIQRYKRVEDIEHCHLLFINAKEDASKIKTKLAQIPHKVLTVSDNPDFSSSGGMIRLTKDAGKIKIVINPAAVKAEDLVVSSKLMSLAEIFETPRNQR